ncbi:hypothetical protein BH23PLA1_BH23PLA1_10660 [soil metagenome]
MELTFECPECSAVVTIHEVEARPRAFCGCGFSRELASEAVEGGSLQACPWCSTEDLYIQKDFPHILGLLIIVTGFIISTAFYFYYMPVAALVVLLLTAALDLLLYYVVPDVTICYRCLGQYRGAGINLEGRYVAFDLAIGERYRQERLRVEELRSRQRSGTSGPLPPARP